MQNENLLDGLRINDFVKLLTLILTIYYTGIMFKKISLECFIFARPTWSARTKTLLYICMNSRPFDLCRHQCYGWH